MIARASCILILAGVLVVSVPEFAAGQDPTPSPTPIDKQYTWNNTGTNFNDVLNWNPGGGPPGAGDVAAFNAAEVTQPQLTASTSISGLYFTGTGTSGYDLTRSSTQTLTLTAFATTIGNEKGDSDSVAIGAENTSGTNTIDVPIILAPSSLSTSTIFQAAGGTLVINGAISGSGIGLSKTGGGKLVLSGANTYTGATTISAGTLQLGNGGTSGSLSTSSTITDNGTFTINRSNAVSQGTDFSGSAITGTGSFVQAGSGTTTLTAANSYTGTTTVNAGKLLVNGSLAASSAVTVNNSGSVLGGTGTINGSASIASSGAILQGGTGSTGQTLTLKGAVTMSTGSVIQLALGPSLTHSTIAISSPGTLSFATNQDFKFIDLGVTTGTYTGIITGVPDPGTALNSWVIDNAGFTGTFSWDSANGGEIDVTLTKVPEPGTWGAAALALLSVGYMQRKRLTRVCKRAAVSAAN